MIDNLTAVYKALHGLPDELEVSTNLIDGLTERSPDITSQVTVERLTKATVYHYTFTHDGIGVGLDVRTMQGPFTVQKFMFHTGGNKYPCTVIDSVVTLKDYKHVDKVEVEELLSKISRLITDITLNYEDEV